MKLANKVYIAIFLVIFTVTTILIATNLERNLKIVTPNQAVKPTIYFGSMNWESLHLNNAIARYVLETAYGYPTAEIKGTTQEIKSGIRANKIDLLMEYWIDTSVETYDQFVKSKKMNVLSTLFSDAAQGIYVPTYLINGDASRNLKPLLPELRSVDDLKKYWTTFKRSSTSQKAVFSGSPANWDTFRILTRKIKGYGLSDKYELKAYTDEAALNADILKAFNTGAPWVGYYWAPTWIMGKYDFTLLKEQAYDKTTWDRTNLCAYPPTTVAIVSSNLFERQAPDASAFLKKYKIDSAIMNDALAHMHEYQASNTDTAKWFLREHQDLLYDWLPEAKANQIVDALAFE